MAATDLQGGFDAIIKQKSKMGPTEILQSEQRVEIVRLTLGFIFTAIIYG